MSRALGRPAALPSGSNRVKLARVKLSARKAIRWWLLMAAFVALAALRASWALQVSRLKDYSNEQISRADGARRARPPTRPLPPETIVLEDGATTFVSSLDDFLARQTEREAAAAASAESEANDEGEEESERTTAGAVVATSTTVTNATIGERQQSRPEVEVAAAAPSAAAANESAQPLERNSKLAIVFASSPPAEEAPAFQRAQPGPAESHAPAPASNRTQQPESGAANSSAAASSGVLVEPAPKHQHGGGGEHGGAGESQNKTKPIPQHWQVKSLLNVTHDYPLAYSQIICGYVWPLMAAITLFTNLMIVFVLTQRDMRTPTNAVLTAIAIADIIPIVVPVPWFVYLFAMGNEKQVLYPPVACYFYQHSTRSISEIFYFLSTWLNVLLAIQDYLAACRPKLARKYCQIRVVVLEIVLLTLLAFLLNLPQALKLVFKPVKFYYNGQLTWGCKALQARWFKDLVGEYVALYDDIFTAIIVLFVDGGPAVVLITLTALLIRQLHQRRIQGHKLMEQARTASKRRRERHRQQEYEASARVMIFVLLAFLAVKIPFATTYTLMIIQSRFEIHFVENLVDFQKAITLTDLVFVLSYPINFTIFCCCSKKFRHKCAQLLGECNDNSRQARARLMSSLSGSLSDSMRTASFSRRHSTAASANRLMAERADSLATDDGGAPAAKKLSLAEYANNAHIPPFSRPPTRPITPAAAAAPPPPLRVQQQALQSARSSASSLSLFVARSLAESARRKSSQPAPVGRQCDGCERQRALATAGEAAAAAQLRRLLDEGRLCLECIVCYESIRNESAPPASQLDQQQQQQQADYLRRISQASDSSFSWSGAMAPPAPPPPMRSLATIEQQQLQLQQQLAGKAQLPQIVTTTCESIREQTSVEEGLQAEEAAAEAAAAGLSFAELEWELERRHRQQARHSASSQELEFPAAAATSRHSIGGADGRAPQNSRASTEASEAAGAVGRAQRSKSRDTHDYEWAAAAYQAAPSALARPATSMMARACSSDPGDVHEQAARCVQAAVASATASDALETSGLEENAELNGGGARRRRPRQRRRLRRRRRSWRTRPGPAAAAGDGRSLEASAEDEGEEEERGDLSASHFYDEDQGELSERQSSRERSDARTTTSEQTEATRRKRARGQLTSGAGPSRERASLGSRQRSLSLSNSNLTTLPNATGMLADVLVSVLFGGAGAGASAAGARPKKAGGRKAHKK